MTDWFRVIVDLEKAGWSHQRIAAKLQVHKNSVGYWKNGGMPRYDTGDALLRLHAQEIGPSQDVTSVTSAP